MGTYSFTIPSDSFCNNVNRILSVSVSNNSDEVVLGKPWFLNYRTNLNYLNNTVEVVPMPGGYGINVLAGIQFV